MIQSALEAKKDGLRQTQDGLWKLTLTIHPNDFPQAIAMALPGTRYMVAFAEIGDDEQPVGGDRAGKPDNLAVGDAVPPQAAAPASPPAPRPFHTLPRSQQAALLGNDPGFQAWAGVTTAYDAAAFVRTQCRVNSRSELDDGIAAGHWAALLHSYLVDTGQVAR